MFMFVTVGSCTVFVERILKNELYVMIRLAINHTLGGWAKYSCGEVVLIQQSCLSGPNIVVEGQHFLVETEMGHSDVSCVTVLQCDSIQSTHAVCLLRLGMNGALSLIPYVVSWYVQ